MKKIYGLFLILTLGIFALGILINRANALLYIDFASLIIVVVPALILLLSNFSWKEMGASFSIGFKKGPSEEELEKGLLFFEAAQKYLLYSGFIGLMIGLIVLIGALGENSEGVASGFSLSLVTVLYALILVLVVVFPFKHGIKKRLIEAGLS